MCMGLVVIMPAVTSWSEVLCCTILTQMTDLDVKVVDFKILCLSFWNSIPPKHVDGSSDTSYCLVFFLKFYVVPSFPAEGP